MYGLTSNSVICTSTPSSANLLSVIEKLAKLNRDPGLLLKWAWNPTQSIGTPRLLKSCTVA
jgi:hypothetical protein